MTVLGHSIPWGRHIGDRHTTDAKGRYAPFKTWLATRKAARQEPEPAALEAHWDAEHEAVRDHRADAACDMVAPSHPHLIAMAFHGIGA
jgi:hypothetical protein